MQLALDKAKTAKQAHPNPKVGCVIHLEGQAPIVACHEKYGQAHAEVNAFKAAEAKGFFSISNKVNVYVTLEPCYHQGKTPACLNLFKQYKNHINKVFIACKDPNPKVSGQSINELHQLFPEVNIGILEKEAEELNKEWMQAQKQGFPYIRLKMATSLDFKFFSESGQSKWITNPACREHAKINLRQNSDALLTSYQTIKKDNPKYHGLETIIIHSSKMTSLNEIPEDYHIHQKKIHFINNKDDLKKLLTEKSIINLLIEAGPKLTNHYIQNNLFNKIWHYQAPIILGGNQAPLKAFNSGDLPGLKLSFKSHQLIDGNWLNVFER